MLLAVRVLRVVNALLVPALLLALADALAVRQLVEGAGQDYGPLALLSAAAGVALVWWCAAAARAAIPCTALLVTAVLGFAALVTALILGARGTSFELHTYLVALPSPTPDRVLLTIAVVLGALSGRWTVRRSTRG